MSSCSTAEVRLWTVVQALRRPVQRHAEWKLRPLLLLSYDHRPRGETVNRNESRLQLRLQRTYPSVSPAYTVFTPIWSLGSMSKSNVRTNANSKALILQVAWSEV